MDKRDLVSVFDYEAAARKKLPKVAYDYYASGANDEITLHENHAAYERIKLKPRVLTDISKWDITTTVLGQTITMPLLVAPTAFHRMAHPEGEIATARAAGKAGTIMILSTLSTSSIEEVMPEATGTVWFQLYVYKDREATLSLVQRAESSGCRAIALTVDAQIWGRRERDIKNRFRLPKGLSIKNLMPAGREQFPKEKADSGLAAYVAWQFDPTLSWKDVDWLCSKAKIPVLLKGVLHPEDARLAIDHGAAGVIVSNHGARQLDTVPATIEALPEIAEAVDGKIEVLIDGGIRRGTDVVKAIALGAKAVGVGRPIIWGLALDGEQGAKHVLDILRRDFELAMRLCGCTSVQEITKDLIC
ncbi:MAG: alpha-hydroxy-acid oxidizing protein [Deltaproteobacteria bacterium]|nr:MAG: alpha-hydroxy-acid oxidizing protein [Deltaproteobacteria bacterium]